MKQICHYISEYMGVLVAVTAVKKPVPVSYEPFFGSMSGQEFSFPASAMTLHDGWHFLPGLGRDEGVIAPSPMGGRLGRGIPLFPRGWQADHPRRHPSHAGC